MKKLSIVFFSAVFIFTLAAGAAVTSEKASSDDYAYSIMT